MAAASSSSARSAARVAPRCSTGVDGSAIYTLYGAVGGDFFGHDVSGGFDVDGDQVPDFMVTAWFDNSNGPLAGRAQVFSGATGLVIHDKTGFSFDLFGNACDMIGDLNGDGRSEFIVGAFSGQGRAQVFNGIDGTSLWNVPGDASGDAFGVDVNAAGDFNNDGFPDFVVGAYLADANGVDSGMARVYSGQTFGTLNTFNGDAAGDEFGDSVAGAGDYDNDGFDDIIVGASTAGALNNGMARVLSGGSGFALATWTGTNLRENLGSSVSGAGDVNNDGYDDVIYGISGDDTAALDAGAAVVRSGFDDSVLHTYLGDAADDTFGSAVEGVGDVNGDGFSDVLVGAFRSDLSGGDAGMARLFQECGGSITEYGSGCAGSGGFTPHLGVRGCPGAGGVLQVSITDGLGSSIALFIVGTAQASFPFGSKCSVLTNPINIVPVAIPLAAGGPGDGEITFSANVPLTVTGQTFTLQVLVQDRALGVGATSSNGVQLVFP